MPDIGTISALLTSVKTATDIAKLVKDSGSSLEAAEIKLNMAELISTLADVKIELAEVQDELRAKELSIQRLENELSKKQGTTFDGRMYWSSGDDTPFCAICMEKDEKYHHLSYLPKGEYCSEQWYCKICKNKVYL